MEVPEAVFSEGDDYPHLIWRKMISWVGGGDGGFVQHESARYRVSVIVFDHFHTLLSSRPRSPLKLHQLQRHSESSLTDKQARGFSGASQSFP